MKVPDRSRAGPPASPVGIPTKIRVLVLDDHEFVRHGLCAMINAEADMMVCGAGAVTRFDPAVLPSLRPDVVLVDVAGSQRAGLTLVQAMKRLAIKARVVALAMYSRPMDVMPFASAGASHFVFEVDVADRVLKAVRRAMESAAGAEPPFERVVRRRDTGIQAPTARAFLRFNASEREVIAMIGAGVPTETIAVRLRVSLRAVHAHIRHIKAKANVATGVALVRYCVAWLRRNGRGRGVRRGT